MAVPKKLPSGNWNVRVFSHMENGRPKYVSFTAPTKAEANRLASEFMCEKKDLKSGDITIKKAISEYIRVKENVLSPSTIREYKRSAKTNYHNIEMVRISQVTNSFLQDYINNLSISHSAKSVRNIYALLISAIKMYSDKAYKVTMPQKEVIVRNIPTDSEVKLLMDNATPELKLAITLASIGTLRRGEICGLKYKDVLHDFNAIYVHTDMVKGPNGWTHKEIPKTDSSVRRIVLPKEVIQMIGNGDPEDYIYPYTPNSLTQSFIKLRDSLGLKCRFHDLRHYAASILHSIGVPDVYIMERGGWSNDTTLKQVYRNSLSDKASEFTAQANSYFEKML